MEKLKRWHLALIVAVVVLTVYNVLPTIIYYSKPLSKPIDQKQALAVASQSFKRVNQLQDDSVNWVHSFSKNLGIKPKSVKVVDDNPQLIEVALHNSEQAKVFKSYLPRAGSLVSFVPSQLSLAPVVHDTPNTVFVERKIGFVANPNEIEKFISFVPKKTNDQISPDYRDLIHDRCAQLALGLAGSTPEAELIAALPQVDSNTSLDVELLELAQNIVIYPKYFGEDSLITKRYLQRLSQVRSWSEKSTSNLLKAFHKLAVKQASDIESLKTNEIEKKEVLSRGRETILQALQILERQQGKLKSSSAPLSIEDIHQKLKDQPLVVLGNNNPFIHSIRIDWEKETLFLSLHPDLVQLQTSLTQDENMQVQKERLKQLIINEIAYISQASNEEITPRETNGFEVQLEHLTNSTGMLKLDLAYIAQNEVQKLKDKISKYWNPQSPEFANNAFPVWDTETYRSLDPSEKKFGLLLYAPVADQQKTPKGFDNSSIYVIAKGLHPIIQKYQQWANLEEAEVFKEEFVALQNIFRQNGYQFSYPADAPKFDLSFQGDFIFENPSYYSDVLAATREDFTVSGSKRYATLEFTNTEQRLATLNRIEGEVHEELLKWKDDYQAAKVDIFDKQAIFFIPPPTKNIYLNNLKLSVKEYFRGDHRKVLKWGLDLSGGKSILIGLKDLNNRPITSKEDLAEGANELTQRVNKMGLSEVDIRVEGNNIALDFPSSQGLSATELIKGSTMSFHVVNEKFASKNSPFYAPMQKFLQEVWNEAVITHQKDAESIQSIAWRHLGGSLDSTTLSPRSEHAKELVKNGFMLPSPKEMQRGFDAENTVSSIGVYRGQDYTQWQGQTHPLIPLFNDHALEGSDLDNIRTSYDAAQGNTLTFNVKNTSKTSGKENPRNVIHAWTSKYAKERVMGTSKEQYTPSRGWRLAIVLNGQIINDPMLNQPLRDNIQVTGGFTQHEVNRLASDLKAGSLSFTPQILSEENVSADLGHAERVQGIVAMLVALTLVVVLMVSYYRFSGLVASVAVLFNLLVMWGTLQNLQATLTLSGIAGIILTVGMAVDANVLVFERIREELKHTKQLGAAIAVGYQKAFSAIFDSNITTIIAAIILLSFDAGPIKGLAITLTIGIASSMFTALFMTRVFFTQWLKKTQQKTLKMANWFHVRAFDFLRYARPVAILSIFTILIGGTLVIQQRKSIVGMDFTGGYSVSLQLEEKAGTNYREKVSSALQNAGAKLSDFQVRELNSPQALRVQLSSSLEEKGRPFFGMPLERGLAGSSNTWQNNPRLDWVVLALQAENLEINAKSLSALDKNWSNMSGQLSKTTRNNAFIGLSLAMLFILIYISFRYEIKYALSAILCVLHDVLITLALIGILHLMKVPVQINMQIIAALMTIIGYSLNDTIIVFDRIREEKRLLPNLSFAKIINHSLSVTLNRTLMTSLTTFVVLFALVTLGGSKIFDFSLVMSLGVILGTLSSLFIAPLLLSYFHKKETQATPYVSHKKNRKLV